MTSPQSSNDPRQPQPCAQEGDTSALQASCDAAAPADAAVSQSNDQPTQTDRGQGQPHDSEAEVHVHSLLAVSQEDVHNGATPGGSHAHHAHSHEDGHRHHRHHHHHKHHHHHHRSKGRKIARGILIALLVIVLAALIIAGALAIYLFQAVKSGEQKVLSASSIMPAATQQAETGTAQRAETDATQQAETGGSDKAATQQAETDASDSDTSSTSKTSDKQTVHLYTPTINNTITYKGKTYAPNEKMVNIAFIGFDGGVSGGTVGQADAVLLFTFNLETSAVKVIVVPRDSMVDVSEYVGDAYIGQDKMQLCLAYSFGDGAWTSSQHVSDLVSRVLYDVPVGYYFTLNLQGISALNDSIGGVTLTPLQTIGKSENVVEGQQTTLWGDDARLYVQWRDSNDNNSSLDRQSRQMQYLSAFFSQVISAAQADPTVLTNLYDTASQYSWTTLGFDEFSYLATQALSADISSIDVVSLPGTMTMGEKYAEYYLDKEGVRQIVLDTFYHEVDTKESTDELSEERGKADNASIASEASDAADGTQAAEGEQASTDATQATEGDATSQEASAEGRSEEDQSALDAASAAVGEAAANW